MRVTSRNSGINRKIKERRRGLDRRERIGDWIEERELINLLEITRLETFGERERESYWTLRLRETTDSYSGFEGNQ